MDTDLSHKFNLFQRRVSQLQDFIQSKVQPQDTSWAETFLELASAVEELQVAQEEIWHQSDELTTISQTAEHERQRYRSLFEFAPDAYLVTDTDGTIREANEAASVLLCVPRHFLLNKVLAIFIADEDRLDFRTRLINALQTKVAQRWETHLQPRDGVVVDIGVVVAVARDLHPGTEVLRWMLRDISDNKRREQQIRALNAELEQRVQERTQQLQQALHERDQFLSVAAHELKTPVTSLRVFSQLLLRRLEQDSTLSTSHIQQGLQIFEQQTEKLVQLTARLLDISHLDAGQLQLERYATEVVSLVQDIISATRIYAPQHPIVMNAPQSLKAWVDPLRLGQVLTNLLDNAIKYSEGSETIIVDISALNDHTVQIAVTDHGIGIAPERREHIFEKFYQAHRENNRGGIGLGLYISRRIVELHGGTIGVGFPTGGGTCFIVTLPQSIDGALLQIGLQENG